MEPNEKEEFINKISSYPYWVKNMEDMEIYSTHLNYRLLQQKEMSRKLWQELKNILSENVLEELSSIQNKIYIDYDRAYGEIKKDKIDPAFTQFKP